MSDFTIDVTRPSEHVSVVEFQRGANNFFSQPMVDGLADTLDELAGDGMTRAVVLLGSGRHFCAGADFGADDRSAHLDGAGRHLYESALRLFEQPLPLVAAISGGAIGGGLGLALACDFRIAATSSRFAAPFARLGLHQGFGLTVTLPHVVGHQSAIDLLYTGRRIKADEALSMGLVDEVVDVDDLVRAALARAGTIAGSAPLSVRAIRKTMRGFLVDAVRRATAHEKAEQDRLRVTADAAEGILADRERRSPNFLGL